jgi:RimJ/RimL family protein N-acetyltransferase
MSKSKSRFPSLTTERLLLRPLDHPQQSDLEAIVAVFDSSYAHRIMGDVGVHNIADLEARCKRFDPQPRDWPDTKPFPTHPFHLIYLRDTPDKGPVGFVGMYHRRPLPAPDIGYFVHEEHTRKGYATEACLAALMWWRDEMGIKDIWIGTFDNNLASQRVAKKMGFIDGGIITFILGDQRREGRAFVQAAGNDDQSQSLDGLVVDVTQPQLGS